MLPRRLMYLVGQKRTYVLLFVAIKNQMINENVGH